MKIQVTQDRIDRATKCSLSNCVMALTLRETLGDGQITVGKEHVWRGWRHLFVMPPEMYEYALRFDRGEAVEPREFDIPIPGRES